MFPHCMPLVDYVNDAAVFSVTSSITSTISWPANVSDNDIAIVVNVATSSSGGAPSGVTPTGFNAGGFNYGSGEPVRLRARVSYRECDGTETGSIVGMNGDESNFYVLLVFRPNFPAEFISGTFTHDAEVTDGDPPSVSLSSVSSSPLILSIAFVGTDGTASFSSLSPTFDDSITTSGGNLLLYYKVDKNSAQALSADANDLGNKNILAVAQLQFS